MIGDENVYVGTGGAEKTLYTEGSFKAVAVPSAAVGRNAYFSASKNTTSFLSGGGYYESGFKYYNTLRSLDIEHPTYGIADPGLVNTPAVISADGSVVISANSDSNLTFNLYISRYTPGTPMETFPLRRPPGLDFPNSIAISPDNKYAYIGCTGGFIWIVDLENKVEVTTMSPLTVFVNSQAPPTMIVSPDSQYVYCVGRRLLAPSHFGPVKLFKMSDHTVVLAEVYLAPFTDLIEYTIDVSPDGTRVIIVAADAKTLTCYSTADLSEVWSIAWDRGKAAYSLDGKRIYATKYTSNSIAVLDSTDGSEISSLSVGTGGIIALGVGYRVKRVYGQGLVCDLFGGEMVARNGSDSGAVPSKVEIYYTAADKHAREKRATITRMKNPCLYHKNGHRGAMTGLSAQDTESLQWVIFYSKDFGRTWEYSRMVWDTDDFIYSDVCGTADGLEVAAGVKRTTSTVGGFPSVLLEIFVKYSADGSAWSTPVKVPYSADNSPVSIRQKTECGSSMLVIFQGSQRYESKDLGKNWVRT